MFVSLDYVPNDVTVRENVYHRMTFTKKRTCGDNAIWQQEQIKKNIVSSIKIFINFLCFQQTRTPIITRIHVLH